MSEKVKPCPFCGDDESVYPSYNWPGSGKPYAIDCIRCGFDFTPRPGMDVIKMWNTRPGSRKRQRECSMIDWRKDPPPQDGTPIYMRVIQPYRFLPYKPNSQQFKRGEKGRWQMMNEYGGWDNCPHPLGNEWSLTHPFDAKAKGGAT